MKTFLEAIEDIEVKKVLRNRLRLAFQSRSLGRGMINVFSHVPFTETLLPFAHTLDFAASNKNQFDYWFDCLQERAYIDLFDLRGNFNAEMLYFLAPYIGLENTEQITKSLLHAYCQHFIGQRVIDYGRASFSEWWSDKMKLLLASNFSLTMQVKNLIQNEWQRLRLLWRWMQYCAQHVKEDPKRFCVAIEYFYYAVQDYLYLNHDLPFDEEKMTMISERIVADVGFVLLEQEEANAISALYHTFYQISKNKMSSDLLQQVAQYQSSIIGQFFILGVMLNHSEDSQMNVNFLIHQSECHPAAVDFSRAGIQNYFFHRHDVFSHKNGLQHIKSILQCLHLNSKLTLQVRIQEAIKTRQVLAYWLKFHAEKWPKLQNYFLEGLCGLFDIDLQLKEYAEILDRMKWIKSNDTCVKSCA